MPARLPRAALRRVQTTAPRGLRRMDPHDALNLLVETEDGDLTDEQAAALGDAVRAALPPRP